MNGWPQGVLLPVVSVFSSRPRVVLAAFSAGFGSEVPARGGHRGCPEVFATVLRAKGAHHPLPS
jgi:hypothetical protein